ncbi:MAG: universal stress protein [Acidobacteriaceae bacterium]|nr:universal stress protein [Acidobacteriaceae bacterium]
MEHTPTHFRSILFPVDFSRMCETTAPHVLGLARLTGAHVTLLHVLPWLSAWHGSSEVIHPAVFKHFDSQAFSEGQRLALERFQEKFFSNCRCSLCIKEGAVAETVAETAAEIGADLIMMPTRGLGPSRRFLIGSTTAKVLHDAPCAVWTSPHTHTLRPFTGINNLLCTIDRNEVLLDFLREAIRLARSFNARLSFVNATHGEPDCEQRMIRPLGDEYPMLRQHQDLQSILNCRVFVEGGPIGEVVHRILSEEPFDLMLINRGHLQQPFGKLRTHTYEIVLESTCPVLSLCMGAAAAPRETREQVALHSC